MDFELVPLTAGLMQAQMAEEICRCNEYTTRFGLALTPAQATALAQCGAQSLLDNGRIEFGSGIAAKLIRVFCDSPYLSAQSYTETLQALVELFYYYKNETLDRVTDDELIAYMKAAFDGECQGSLELLEHNALERLAENLQFGRPIHFREQAEDEEDEDEWP